MRIAFYLPGGRLPEWLRRDGAEAAGLLGAALRLAGHDVRRASRFCSRSNGGAASREERMSEVGLRLAGRLLARYRRRPPEDRPQAWISCAVSDEAPDWLGPTVSRGLGIPYLLVQPSVVQPGTVQPESGPVEPASGPAAADTPLRSALAAADAVVTVGSAGIVDSRSLVDRPERLVELLPFLDLAPVEVACRDRARHRTMLATRWLLSADAPWLIATAGTDSAPHRDSIELLARLLSRASTLDWNLIVVGDGPACEAADAVLRVLPRARVKLYPSLADEDLIPLYAASDLFLGPLVGEGSRTAMLLAMACGLPIVARRDDTAAAEIVRDGLTGRLALPGNVESFGNMMTFLLRQPPFRTSLAENARNTAIIEHDIAAAAERLHALLCGELTNEA